MGVGLSDPSLVKSGTTQVTSAKAAHGLMWSDLAQKSDQTRNFGLKNFQTRPDKSKHQTESN